MLALVADPAEGEAADLARAYRLLIREGREHRRYAKGDGAAFALQGVQRRRRFEAWEDHLARSEPETQEHVE